MANAKQFFKLDKTNPRFVSMNDSEKILVEEGFELVKRYVANKVEQDGKVKKAFADTFDNIVGKEVDASRNEKFVSKLVEYSLRSAGRDVTNFELSQIKNPMLHNNVAFRQTFNVILSQIITPVIPALISAEYMDMADISNIGWGDTARFKVNSNDTFYVTRQAEGILTGTVQRVYNDEITVNPEPFNITTTVDWYQVAAGVFDIGEFAYKVGVSYSNHVTMMVINAMQKFVTNNLPAAYKTNGFSTATFARLVDTVKAANGNATNVRAYGTLTALMNVIPGTASSTVVAGLQQGLGKEWTSMGYLGRYFGVDMVRIPQILVPNTVNTEALLGVPENVIYLMADGGYNPVKIVIEGSALTVDIKPTESADKEMGISMTFRMGLAFVNASKFGAVTNIVAPNM